jgi:DNA end-binding protein Ku
MRSILNTTIAFGMVRIPVKLYAATGSHDLGLHQYHAADAGRIRYEKVCELDDEPVPAEEIRKGVETEDGEVVLLDEEDFQALPESSSKQIEVVQFVPAEQIDPIYYERSYYVGPGTAGGDPYVLLREALLDAGKAAVVRLTMRQRESLAALRPRDEILVLDTMLWADEIYTPEISSSGGKLEEAELEMAGILIDARTGSWDPEKYRDEYQEALLELIEAKQEGRPAPKAKPEKMAKVINLMDALQRSVEQADPERLPEQQSGRKAAKKTAKKAARKTAAKKSTAKQTAAKKSAKQAAPRSRKRSST